MNSGRKRNETELPGSYAKLLNSKAQTSLQRRADASAIRKAVLYANSYKSQDLMGWYGGSPSTQTHSERSTLGSV